MKVSVDGILGSARKINNQRQLDEDNLGKKKKDIKSDSVSIGTKVNSRIDSIETELRDIQSSLTSNQIIKDGIEQLRDDYNRGGSNQEAILSEVKFEGEDVLKNFIREPVDGKSLDSKYDLIVNDITDDASRLKKLQVEVDNIMASNLAGTEKVDNLMTDINSVVLDIQNANLDSISSLRPDAVMRLIR